MGNLIKVLTRDIDNNDAQPSQSETAVWEEVNQVLTEARVILEDLQAYRGAGEEIRQHLEQKQALARQFAHILHFTLRFDELKVRLRSSAPPSLYLHLIHPFSSGLHPPPLNLFYNKLGAVSCYMWTMRTHRAPQPPGGPNLPVQPQ
ncbi:Protein FAM49A [Larimichthys crocea]|uniref:Uncharacterized protein n=1 Tax=Larimichthys crocea TaxID=215358 RepID=A0ACD3QS04_LARCR|nr:Protein FAM49A [Larimichthys crocea]